MLRLCGGSAGVDYSGASGTKGVSGCTTKAVMVISPLIRAGALRGSLLVSIVARTRAHQRNVTPRQVEPPALNF